MIILKGCLVTKSQALLILMVCLVFTGVVIIATLLMAKRPASMSMKKGEYSRNGCGQLIDSLLEDDLEIGGDNKLVDAGNENLCFNEEIENDISVQNDGSTLTFEVLPIKYVNLLNEGKNAFQEKVSDEMRSLVGELETINDEDESISYNSSGKEKENIHEDLAVGSSFKADDIQTNNTVNTGDVVEKGLLTDGESLCIDDQLLCDRPLECEKLISLEIKDKIGKSSCNDELKNDEEQLMDRIKINEGFMTEKKPTEFDELIGMVHDVEERTKEKQEIKENSNNNKLNGEENQKNENEEELVNYRESNDIISVNDEEELKSENEDGIDDESNSVKNMMLNDEVIKSNGLNIGGEDRDNYYPHTVNIAVLEKQAYPSEVSNNEISNPLTQQFRVLDQYSGSKSETNIKKQVNTKYDDIFNERNETVDEFQRLNKPRNIRNYTVRNDSNVGFVFMPKTMQQSSRKYVGYQSVTRDHSYQAFMDCRSRVFQRFSELEKNLSALNQRVYCELGELNGVLAQYRGFGWN